MQGSFTIAIDGPAAAGKGTISRALAAHFGCAHLDTGLLYRATGARVAAGLSPLEAAETLSEQDLARDDLRSAEAGQAASRVAALPEVRAALVAFQRSFARQKGGAVLDGRDIGTVIAPHAPAKLYVTARPEVRAERRWKQLVGQGEEVAFEDILADIHKRDARDGGRKDAPMTQAADAVLLDTSEMTIEQAFDAARRIVEDARARHRL